MGVGKPTIRSFPDRGFWPTFRLEYFKLERPMFPRITMYRYSPSTNVFAMHQNSLSWEIAKTKIRKRCVFVTFRGHLRTRPISPTQNNFSWLNNFVDWKNFEKKKFYLESTVFEILAAHRFLFFSVGSTCLISDSGAMGMPRWYLGPKNGILLTYFVTLIKFGKRNFFLKSTVFEILAARRNFFLKTVLLLRPIIVKKIGFWSHFSDFWPC